MKKFLEAYWPSMLGVILFSIDFDFREPANLFVGFFLGILFHGYILWMKS